MKHRMKTCLLIYIFLWQPLDGPLKGRKIVDVLKLMNTCSWKKVYIFIKTGEKTKVKWPTATCASDAEVQ